MLSHDPRPATDTDEPPVPEPVEPIEKIPAPPGPSDDQQQHIIPN